MTINEGSFVVAQVDFAGPVELFDSELDVIGAGQALFSAVGVNESIQNFKDILAQHVDAFSNTLEAAGLPSVNIPAVSMTPAPLVAYQSFSI